MRAPLFAADFNGGLWTGRAVVMPAKEGTTILCPHDGHVYQVWHDAEQGHAISLHHGRGEWSVFTHLLAAPKLAPGEWVGSGQAIGQVGSAGARGWALVWHYTREGKPADPRPWFASPRGLGIWVAVCGLLTLGVAFALSDDAPPRPSPLDF